MFTETDQRIGDHLGQVMIGLKPKTAELRTVEEMIESMREAVVGVPGPIQVSFLRISGGPPTQKPISIKVRGDDYAEITAAAQQIKQIMRQIDGIKDIEDDADKGRSELVLDVRYRCDQPRRPEPGRGRSRHCCCWSTAW